MKRLTLLFIAVIVTSGWNKVYPQGTDGLMYPASFRSELIAPILVVKKPDGSWFADFGRAAFGNLFIKADFESPDTLIIHLGEKLTSAGVIDRNPGGSIRYQKVLLAVNPSQKEYLLRLPPDKRNSNPPAVALPDSFGVITPFRYCEIYNMKGSLSADNLRQKAWFYIFDETKSAFTSSDTILNRIWDLCKYSMKATSFCGLYIDGDRERIPYEGDALINQLSHYAVDSEYTLAKRTNEYFMSNPTWPTEWILHTVILFYYDYLYTGDRALLEKYYDALKTKTLIDLAREDGLISVRSERHNDDLMRRLGFRDVKQRMRDIVDWPPAQKDTGWKLATPEGERDGYEMTAVNTVVNSFHFYNLRLMSEMAEWLGRNDDELFFRERSEKVKESVNSRLFNTEKGIYTDGEGSSHSSLHANMFPLAFGIVPEEHTRTVVEFIKSRGMACSVYGAQHLLDGLYNAGEEDYALELMTSLSERSWWNMIRIGSTITLEAWDMKFKPNSDWNHAWGAAPGNIISRRMWGIQPAEPGFRKAVIRPQLGSLNSSSIMVPALPGNISASYTKTGANREVFSITIPSGMTAEFTPQHDKYRYKKILVNKKRSRQDTVNLAPGNHIIELIKMTIGNE